MPLVFYQGERTWSYASEFAELFAESVRDWPWVPRFSHELIDQSGMQPREAQGELKTRLMQVLLLAAYHPERPWTELAVELIDILSALLPSGGLGEIRVFLRYVLQTQDQKAIESFQEALRRRSPDAGGDLMSYAQELLEEGRDVKEQLWVFLSPPLKDQKALRSCARDTRQGCCMCANGLGRRLTTRGS